MNRDDLKDARILIVDDQASNLRLLERILGGAGWTNFRSLTDPREVLPTLRDWPPDLILLDLMMPEIDGLTLMDLIRPTLPPGTYLPILAITADVTPATRQRALASGAKDFLNKPFDNSEVLLRIRNLLETRLLHLRLKEQNQRLEETVRERTREVQEQAALIDKARDAILVTDLSGRIRFWNRGAEDLYGWPGSLAVGASADELLEPAGSDGWRRAREAVLREAEWAGELRQATRAGAPVVVESRWTLVRGEADRPESILVIGTDVTEKRRAEAQHLRSQRLESLGTLASGIAHDLNNILTPILMAADLLGQPAPEGRRLGLIRSLRASAERAAALVRQILSFARGAGGERVPVPLAPLIEETGRLLECSLPKSIELDVSAPPDLWRALADATQVSQVLMNLCVNARDAMPGGGRLTIRAENVHLDEGYARLRPDARPGPYAVVRVADDGTGIDPEILDKIFDPFFTTKEPGRGTGLGLSTVLGIVTGYGGLVDVDSTPGSGTTVSVYLPALPAAADRSAAPARDASPPADGGLVLVVDDEAPVREVTRAALEARGYRVREAAQGAEALELFAAHRAEVRLVLTDMTMPVMDGAATIRALRALDPRLPIVACSGLAESLSEAALDALSPPPALLSKPFTADELDEAIRRALEEAPPGPALPTAPSLDGLEVRGPFSRPGGSGEAT